MISNEQQKKRLQALLKFGASPTVGHCNFGAMVYLEPRGDVCFLAPIAPELRGIEIVSASSSREDGRHYDIWKRRAHGMKMLKSDQTMTEIMDWLQSQCHHTEQEYLRHGAAWVEDVFCYYQIKP